MDPEKIKAFLSEAGIASCPTVLKAIREKENASDAFLKVVEPVPLADVLEQILTVSILVQQAARLRRFY